MRTHMIRIALACVSVAWMAAAPARCLGQSITWLGVLPGDNSSNATAVSSDGKFVIGVSGAADGYHPFIWTRGDGMIPLPLMTEYPSCVATDVTLAPDPIVCGYCSDANQNSRPVRWDNPNSIVSLDTSRYAYGKAWAISPTGRIAGEVNNSDSASLRAVYWETDGSMVDISNNGQMFSTRDISDDGRVIVGFMRSEDRMYSFACYWFNGNIFNISRNNTTQSLAYGVSNDGRVIVGMLADADNSPNAFRWENGTSITLGRLGKQRSYASASNGNGSVIVGFAERPGSVAFRWTSTTGIKDLNIEYSSLLSDGSQLFGAFDITPDGRYIVGWGYNAATRRIEGYILDTQPSCLTHNGDVDENGCVDDGDLLQVLFNFGSSGANLGRVDINCDETVDDADLLIVLFNFGVGC